jgi:acetyl-CoA C-acetyltransferase
MALASQRKAVAAQQAGHLAAEIVPVPIPQGRSRTKACTGETTLVSQDEHPRANSLEARARLKGVVRPDGTVTAGNASGVNDGSCALLLASEAAAARHGLRGCESFTHARPAGHHLPARRCKGSPWPEPWR